MGKILLYPVGSSDSCRYASVFLQRSGIPLTDHPEPEITHLMLDIPSFHPDGSTRDGSDLNHLLRMLPKKVTVIGGNLDTGPLEGYKTIDLLKDPCFLARNAAITAECALRVAAPHLKTTFADSPTLILGWGRIGKCLAKLLSALGCPVTVAARKEQDRAMLTALGYAAVDFSQIGAALKQCRLLLNTVPNVPLRSEILDPWKNGTAIDLASLPGMQGKHVIPARGLPGKYAPETTGKLIAETIGRILKEETL